MTYWRTVLEDSISTKFKSEREVSCGMISKNLAALLKDAVPLSLGGTIALSSVFLGVPSTMMPHSLWLMQIPNHQVPVLGTRCGGALSRRALPVVVDENKSTKT